MPSALAFCVFLRKKGLEKKGIQAIFPLFKAQLEWILGKLKVKKCRLFWHLA
ncbi:MAG: hypothetical protein HDR44_04445 [Allobaculum sp.]|nr:hypothetical protein [Allobaculum sp.]